MVSPVTTISDLILACEVSADFHKHFDSYTSAYFRVLSSLFPYLMSPDALVRFSTLFIAKYRQLAYFFEKYKKRFPGEPFARVVDVAVSLFLFCKNNF